jgi:ABC-type polysaccharide/polyol phosphate export permease
MTAPAAPIRARTRANVGRTLAEVKHHVAIAWYFAWSDAKARYKRSVLGPFWLVLTTLIGVGGLGIIWGSLMKVDRATFVPLLTVGLVLWHMIAGSVTGASTVFSRSASVIKNIPTPPLRLSLQLLFQQIVNLIHNLVVVAFILVIYQRSLGTTSLLAIPGLLLVLVNLLWVIQFLGFLGARFRDFDPFVSSIMPILFFMSPVLYRSTQLGPQSILMKFNPMSYWIEIVREPVLGTVPHTSAYTVSILMAFVGWVLAIWITRSKGSRLPYWV